MRIVGRLFHTVKIVLSGFIGIRKARDAQAAQNISPKAIIITALGCGLCLILLLILLVKVMINHIQ